MPEKKPSKPIIDMPSKKQMEQAIRPYSEEELSSPEAKERAKRILEWFAEQGLDVAEPPLKFPTVFGPEHFEKKKAYPNYDQYQNSPAQHDTKKWLMALKSISYKEKAGLPYREAIKQTVGDWKKMEVYDFLNWLKFYNEGTPMKYKFAQVWYENGQPGYFLHIKPDAPKEEAPVVDNNAVQQAQEEAERNEEKRNVIEKQRQKIIGRLDSAEKLLRSPEGQQFAGSELEQLMEAIYTLKKKVQLVNKLSVSTRLYEDMIVREGNVLKRSGFTKAAEVLYSLAQTPGQSGEQGGAGPQDGGKVPMDGQPPPDPSGAGQSGTMSGLPATAPGVPNIQSPDDAAGAGTQNDQPGAKALMQGGDAPTGTAESTPAIMPQDPPQPKGIKDFIENMNDGSMTEASEADDQLEVFDDNLEVNDLMSHAQAAPPVPGPGIPPAALEDVPIADSPPPAAETPANLPSNSKAVEAPKDEEPLEVTEKDLPAPGGDTPTGGADASSLDSKLDATFENVTMQEIVAELEDISTYYKVREMPRRLARLDMMFDSKGISAYFPSLAEAQNRALDANNYIATRIDDILAKVRGAMVTQDMGAKLKQDQDKEKQRKQMRKEQENAELEGGGVGGGAGKETPNVEMGELAPPAAQPPPPETPPLPKPPRKPAAV